jgi:hypothetical protein
MATRSLEAKIVLSGTDESGPAFDAAARHAKSLEKTLSGVAHTMRKTGVALTAAVTVPLLLIGKQALERAADFQSAVSQMNVALASMGPVAHRNARQLLEQADAMEKVSLFDKSDIIAGVTNRLLTFGHIHGRVFDLAQKAIVDYAARTGTELPEAAQMLGKALQEPIQGTLALRRAGIFLSPVQQQVIKNLMQSSVAGSGFKAQMVILNEVMKRYGGSALASTKTLAGSFGQLKISVNSTLESFGLMESGPLISLMNSARGTVEWFGKLSDSTKQWIVIVGGIAAAVGPALIVGGLAIKGFLQLRTALIAVQAAFVGLDIAASPWILAAGAIAAAGFLIWKYWQPLSALLSGIAAGFSEAFGPLLKAAKPLAPVFNAIGGAIKGVFTWFTSLLSPIKLNKKEFAEINSLGRAVGYVFGTLIAKPLEFLVDLFTSLAEKISAAWAWLKKWKDLKEGVSTAFSVATHFATGNVVGLAGDIAQGVSAMMGGGKGKPASGTKIQRTGVMMSLLQQLGWAAPAAAAITGNALWESGGLNPGARGDHNTAFGLAQWRNERVAEFARVMHKSLATASLSDQVRFMDYELTKGAYRNIGNAVRRARSLNEATGLINQFYERPKSPGQSQRQRYEAAQFALAVAERLRQPGQDSGVSIAAGVHRAVVDVHLRHDGTISHVRQRSSPGVKVNTGVDHTAKKQPDDGYSYAVHR